MAVVLEPNLNENMNDGCKIQQSGRAPDRAIVHYRKYHFLGVTD